MILKGVKMKSEHQQNIACFLTERDKIGPYLFSLRTISPYYPCQL